MLLQRVRGYMPPVFTQSCHISGGVRWHASGGVCQWEVACLWGGTSVGVMVSWGDISVRRGGTFVEVAYLLG